MSLEYCYTPTMKKKTVVDNDGKMVGWGASLLHPTSSISTTSTNFLILYLDGSWMRLSKARISLR